MQGAGEKKIQGSETPPPRIEGDAAMQNCLPLDDWLSCAAAEGDQCPAPVDAFTACDQIFPMVSQSRQHFFVPSSFVRDINKHYDQWSIEVPSTHIINEGMAALQRLEEMPAKSPEELATLSEKDMRARAFDVALAEKAALEVRLMGTNFGIYPPKALEVAVNLAYEMQHALKLVLPIEEEITQRLAREMPGQEQTEPYQKRVQEELSRVKDGRPEIRAAYQTLGQRAFGERTITISGSILGYNVTAANSLDHTYRTGTALRDAVTCAADDVFGRNFSALPRDPRAVHDSITRFKATSVVIIGVDQHELEEKTAAFRERLRERMEDFASRRDLPIGNVSQVDLSVHAFTTQVTIDPSEMQRGALETKIVNSLLAKLYAGEGAAALEKKATPHPGEFFIARKRLSPEAIEAAGKEFYFLFHAPSTNISGDISQIPPLGAAPESSPLVMSEQDILEGSLMRPAHRFGRLIGEVRRLREAFEKLTGAIRSSSSTRMQKIQEARDVFGGALFHPEGSDVPIQTRLTEDAGLAKKDYAFSENGKDGFFFTKPAYLGEEVAALVTSLRQKAGRGARVRVHLFFSELKKAGDFFSTRKPDLKDTEYRLTLDIPLTGFAQQGMGTGLQSVWGGDEVVWARCEIVWDRADPAFAPENIRRTFKFVQREFHRVYEPGVFQPSEKTPFAGGTYRGIRFGLMDDELERVLLVERQEKGKKGDKVLQQIIDGPEFADFLRATFGVDLAGAVGDPASRVRVSVVDDLVMQGEAVSRFKIWKGPESEAFVYLPPGTVPEGLEPTKTSMDINFAWGKGEPRDMLVLAAELGRLVDEAKKTRDNTLLHLDELPLSLKMLTRPGLRMAVEGSAWYAGQFVANGAIGAVRYLLTGRTGELNRFTDPQAYAAIALGFLEVLGASKAGDLASRAFIERVIEGGKLLERSPAGVRFKPGVFSKALTKNQALGAHIVALVFAAVLPQVLSGQMSAESVVETFAAMGFGMAATSVVHEALTAAKMIGARSLGWQFLSVAVGFTAMEAYGALRDAGRIAEQRFALRRKAVASMRDLDAAIGAVEHNPTDAAARGTVARAYQDFEEHSKNYLHFLQLFGRPEGEAVLRAREKRDEAIVKRESAGRLTHDDVTIASGPDGLAGEPQPPNLYDLLRLWWREQGDYDRWVKEAERDEAEKSQKLFEALRKNSMEILGDPRRSAALEVRAELHDAPDAPEPPLELVDQPFGRVSVKRAGVRAEHPYAAQVSDDPDGFYAQSQIYAIGRSIRIYEATKGQDPIVPPLYQEIIKKFAEPETSPPPK